MTLLETHAFVRTIAMLDWEQCSLEARFVVLQAAALHCRMTQLRQLLQTSTSFLPLAAMSPCVLARRSRPELASTRPLSDTNADAELQCEHCQLVCLFFLPDAPYW